MPGGKPDRSSSGGSQNTEGNQRISRTALVLRNKKRSRIMIIRSLMRHSLTYGEHATVFFMTNEGDNICYTSSAAEHDFTMRQCEFARTYTGGFTVYRNIHYESDDEQEMVPDFIPALSPHMTNVFPSAPRRYDRRSTGTPIIPAAVIASSIRRDPAISVGPTAPPPSGPPAAPTGPTDPPAAPTGPTGPTGPPAAPAAPTDPPAAPAGPTGPTGPTASDESDKPKVTRAP